VINFALELAATLSGAVARLYYVQAENPDAEKCARFTAENGYWADLSAMPLALGRLSRATINLLAERGPLPLTDLYGILRNEYWDLSRGLTSDEVLRELYLTPMRKQSLIAETSGGYVVGPQWELIRPYEESWQQAREAGLTIERLAREELWIEQEEIVWS
jgi:hypothetical protein